jgi:hypothetical protein
MSVKSFDILFYSWTCASWLAMSYDCPSWSGRGIARCLFFIPLLGLFAVELGEVLGLILGLRKVMLGQRLICWKEQLLGNEDL